MSTTPSPATLALLIQWFENLSPETLDQVNTLYAAKARFKDPFNDVEGIVAIRKIFHHMFHQVDKPRFHVTGHFLNEQSAMVLWTFHFTPRRPLPRRPLSIEGTTHFLFDTDGKVILHRDYWDTAGELYAKLPLIGPLVKRLLRRAQA